MKKYIFIALAFFGVLFFSGCATSPIFGLVTVAEWDGAVGDQNVQPTKEGKACANSVLSLIAFGDASIEAAKKDGGITKIHNVDHKTLNIFYFFGQYCTIVKGE